MTNKAATLIVCHAHVTFIEVIPSEHIGIGASVGSVARKTGDHVAVTPHGNLGGRCGIRVDILAGNRGQRMIRPGLSVRPGTIGVIFACLTSGGEEDPRRVSEPRGRMPATSRTGFKTPINPWTVTGRMKLTVAGGAKTTYPRVIKAEGICIPIFVVIGRRDGLLPIRIF